MKYHSQVVQKLVSTLWFVALVRTHKQAQVNMLFDTRGWGGIKILCYTYNNHYYALTTIKNEVD